MATPREREGLSRGQYRSPHSLTPRAPGITADRRVDGGREGEGERDKRDGGREGRRGRERDKRDGGREGGKEREREYGRKGETVAISTVLFVFMFVLLSLFLL